MLSYFVICSRCFACQFCRPYFNDRFSCRCACWTLPINSTPPNLTIQYIFPSRFNFSSPSCAHIPHVLCSLAIPFTHLPSHLPKSPNLSRNHYLLHSLRNHYLLHSLRKEDIYCVKSNRYFLDFSRFTISDTFVMLGFNACFRCGVVDANICRDEKGSRHPRVFFI